jgi:(R,R)-butanediol dehydrogenase/meso-butanediol dehydrogenase/diacetyl reductase
MTMRAAVYHNTQDLRIEEVPEPRPGPGELLVKVAAVGICGTDAHEFTNGPVQYPIHHRNPVTGHLGPMIPGHEPAGVVVEIGAEVAGFAAGDAVASGATTPCGACDRCREGRPTICRNISAVGVHRDGALAEYVVLPAMTCRRLAPYGLSPEVGALAQPMAIAAHAIGRGRLRLGEHALLVGIGGIGAFACYVAAATGARVTVTDRLPDRLELARSLGAHDTVAAGDDPAEQAEQLAALGEADVVYELSGTAAGIRTALAAVRDGGRIVQVGFHHEPRAVDLFRLTLKELEIVGTNSLALYPDLHVALQLLASRREGWRDLAPELIPLEDLVDDGIRPLAERKATRVKTLIDPWARASRALPALPDEKETP